jgi:hypothetical protein
MLKRQILFYKDGRKTDNIIYTDNSTPTITYPKRDNIKHGFLTTYKYDVKLKMGECVALVKLGEKLILMPLNVEVHPKTTLQDVNVIKKKIKEKPAKTFTFKSSSSDSTYTVKEINNQYVCNCTGFFRVKDKKKGCKHIQEIKLKNMKS